MNIANEEKNAALTGILGAFPAKASFFEFKQEDGDMAAKAIPQFIAYAYEHDLIQYNTEEAFLRFLEIPRQQNSMAPAQNFSFSDLLEFIVGEEHSVNDCVKWLEPVADRFKLPRVKAPMLTRLKQDFHLNTAKKRAVVRILAFWIAQNRPEAGWDYEKLLKLPRSVESGEREEGVVMMIDIQGRGAPVVEQDMVEWLKEELSRTIKELKFDSYIKQLDTEADRITSVSLRIPRNPGPKGDPRLYGRAIRDSLALAHQISVRFLLEHQQDYIMRIAIYAGLFAEASFILRAMIEEPSLNNAMVILTDFAHLCTEVADMKVVFQRPAHQIELRRGIMIDVWVVDYFFSLPYFDIIPQLLEDNMLPITPAEYADFRCALYHLSDRQHTRFEILARLHRSPQHTLLALEVVKILIARRMFPEADTILSNIFILYPRHVLARMIRMHIYTCLAAEHPQFHISEQLFTRAFAEADLLTSYSADQPEVWCAYGAIYFERALKYFAALRRGLTAHEPITKEDVFNNLKPAVEKFLKGVTVCPTGKDTRSLFLVVIAQSFLELFQTDDTAFTSKEIQDTGHVFQNVAIRFFAMIGLLRETIARSTCSDGTDPDTLRRQLSDAEHREILDFIEQEMARLYHNTVLMRTFVPNILHATCCFLWDFMPRLTVGLCKRIIQGIETARDKAGELSADRLGIYSAVRFFDYRPEGFIACMETLLNIVKRTIPPEELQQKDDTFLSDSTMEHVSRVKLMLARIGHDIHPGVLLKD